LRRIDLLLDRYTVIHTSAMPGGDEIVLYDDDLIFEFQPDHCLWLSTVS
jgi:hypothetical protein